MLDPIEQERQRAVLKENELSVDDNLPLTQRLRRFLAIPADLPSDAAAQHDHYLYGTPKNP